MRFLGLLAACLFLLFGAAAFASAAGSAPAQPTSNQKFGVGAPPAPAALMPAEYSPLRPGVEVVQLSGTHPDTVQRLWIASICAVLAASAFDAATSWGKQESNPLLTSRDGSFGARGLAIKVGIAGAVIVPQWLLRNHKQLRKGFILENFADTAVFTAAGVHNLGVPGH